MYKQLIYLSRAQSHVGFADVAAIGRVASLRNRAFKVTGLLLYGNGCFMQMLEGPEDCVDALLDTIQSDSRHHHLEVVLERMTDTRFYPDWSMGVYNIESDNGSVSLSHVRDQLRDMTRSEAEIRRNIVLAFEMLRVSEPEGAGTREEAA
jgi:hypothetical protein